MKIAQLTLTGYYNYGNILQKYALHNVLKNYADEVDVLWAEEDNFLPETWEWNWRQKLIDMFNSTEERRKFTFDLIRQSKLKSFTEKYISVRYDIESLENISDDYDYFVIGSDQVWNPAWYHSNFPYEERFLLFTAKKKRIAYAASISIPSIPDDLKVLFREGILGISKLSVREKGTAMVVQELTGINPTILIDPTFLLTESQWSEISQKPSWFNTKYNGGYILTYFLRGEVPHIVNEMAKDLNLPVINLLDLNNFNHYTIGIEEFIFLFEHASLIYTNSFHGTVFSILYDRPFVVCNLSKDVADIDMTSRMDHLLEQFNLRNRKAKEDDNFYLDNLMMRDYAQKQSILNYEREKAKKFLDEALGSARSEN